MYYFFFLRAGTCIALEPTVCMPLRILKMTTGGTMVFRKRSPDAER